MVIPKKTLEEYVKRDLDIIVLTLIKNSSSIWYYTIEKKIRENFGVSISHGIVHPIIRKLEDQGYVGGRWVYDEKIPGERGPSGRRKYTLTSKGEEFLEISERAKGEVWKILEKLSTH